MNKDKVKEALRTLKTEAPEEWKKQMSRYYCPSDWGLEESCFMECEKCWAAALA